MAKIKIEKDNAILSIEEEELLQYEAMGFSKLGATKKADSKDLEKELKKLTKSNEELTAKVAKVEEEKAELTKSNEELTAKVAELEKKVK